MPPSYPSSSVNIVSNKKNQVNVMQSSESHAVNRSSELLACARTALQMVLEEQRNRGDSGSSNEAESVVVMGNVSDLHLYQPHHSNTQGDRLMSLQDDGLKLLSLSESSLQTLSSLVRRRGHTNDPTLEMQQNIQRFQSYMKELHEISTSIASHGSVPLQGDEGTVLIRRGRNNHRKKHYELVSIWLQNRGKERADTFQKAMDMRGKVLKAQVRRRKLLEGRQKISRDVPVSETSDSSTNHSLSNKSRARLPNVNVAKPKLSQMNSPLFTATNSKPFNAPPAATSKSRTTSNSKSMTANNDPMTKNTMSTPSSSYSKAPTSNSSSQGNSYYGGYGGNNYGYGYGGASGAQDGIRRRATTQSQQPNNSNNAYPQQQQRQQQQQHSQLQQQYEHRTQTRLRLEEARKAERSIAELTQIFGKMASLVSSQEEVIENIEYDVENAYMQTEGASKEIGKLYEMKQGNRGLILKVFGILIFMIVFMCFY